MKLKELILEFHFYSSGEYSLKRAHESTFNSIFLISYLKYIIYLYYKCMRKLLEAINYFLKKAPSQTHRILNTRLK